MNRDNKKTETADNKNAPEQSKDIHNPFKDAEGRQTDTEPTKDEEAIAEQQRKEALTERD